MTETSPAADDSTDQARKLAQTELALRAARQNPRTIDRCVSEMTTVCSMLAFVERAFYVQEDRHTGPSVHLMRELARIWGNVEYGASEISRDIAAGRSEMQAHAWDLESNTRAFRGFITSHLRTGGEPINIYTSNQSVGGRAVRECIAQVLPAWFTAQARDLCWATLEHGDGTPLTERRALIVEKFAAAGIKEDQLAKRLGRPRRKWEPIDVTQLSILHTAITREGLDKNELFPPLTTLSSSDIRERPRRGTSTRPDKSPRDGQ